MYEFRCGILEASLEKMLKKVLDRELKYEEVRKVQKVLDEITKK